MDSEEKRVHNRCMWSIGSWQGGWSLLGIEENDAVAGQTPGELHSLTAIRVGLSVKHDHPGLTLMLGGRYILCFRFPCPLS